MSSFLNSLLGLGASKGPVLPESEISPKVIRLVDEYIDRAGETENFWEIDPKRFESGKAILALDRTELVDTAVYGTSRLVNTINDRASRSAISSADRCFRDTFALRPLLSAVLRKQLPFDESRMSALITCLSRAMSNYAWEVSLGGYFRQIESFVDSKGLSEILNARLGELRKSLKRNAEYTETRKALQRLDALLTTDRSDLQTQLDNGEVWTATLRDRLKSVGPSEQSKWEALLSHCQTAGSSKPSKKWLKQTEAQIDQLGQLPYTDLVNSVIGDVGQAGTSERRVVAEYEYSSHPTQVHDTHSDLLRGFIWSTSLVNDERLIQTVGNCAEICFQKLEGIGPRSPKIGNACLWALSNMTGLQAVAQLSRLKTRVKHASVRKQLAKALETAAENAGMSQADLEEIAVPTLGLTQVGELSNTLGEFTARLEVRENNKTDLEWIKSDGKRQKSVPKSVKDDFPQELKLLKQTAKDIEKMLPPVRDRIEQLFLADRSWSWDDFRERYLDHPLVGSLARRLIWRFRQGSEDRAAIWQSGRFVDCNDDELPDSSGETRIDLWHPLMAAPDQVLAWRGWLDRHEVRQPFKQAHREIYVLTDAESTTETHSNRFAAHILRQHQFAALCQQRGWRYSLQGAWDSFNTPTLYLPIWNLGVEFWVEPVAEDESTSESGIYLYVSTDQVRFRHMEESDPLPLTEIPPLVFSEIMRDVDLFVGVASVGNDPNWADGGPQGRYVDYWQSYSFGDLSATAQTRKDVLQRLVPRLKIAGRCSFSDKFLVVMGDLRTYKIHLGSGNILMEPNDEYLCIVPARGGSKAGGDNVFLPFEGDQTLSIILSKAFLLAEDTKIKDPTIVSQIRR